MQRLSKLRPTAVALGAADIPEDKERELMDMVREARYWRDEDPVYVQRVSEGFRKLYLGGAGCQ